MSRKHKKRSEIIFSLLLIPCDASMLFLAAYSAYVLRFSESVQGLRPVFYNLPPGVFFVFTAWIIPVWLFIFACAGLYSMRGNRRLVQEFSRVFVACSLGVLVLIVAFFVQRELFSSRFIVMMLWLFAFVYVAVERMIVRSIQHMLFRRHIGTSRFLIIGADETTSQLLTALTEQIRYGIVPVGHIATLPQHSEEIRRVLEGYVHTKPIDGILVADPSLGHDVQTDVLAFCQEHHLDFRYAADMFNTQATNIEVLPISGIPVIEVKPTPLDGWGRVAKRFFDIVISFVCIVVLLPVMCVVAIAIIIDSGFPIMWRKLDDGSPVQRIGAFGEPFYYFKFRSMRVGTHDQRYRELMKRNVRHDGPLVKIPNDPRVTSVGKFIRAFSLDELPELFLVFIGKMSLVGPRPHLPEEVAHYPEHARKILRIKPGMTGLAQISGRSSLTFGEEVRLDCYYIENWSIFLDLLILCKTPFVVVRRPVRA